MEGYEELIRTNYVAKVLEQSKAFYVLNDAIVMEPKFAQIFLEIPKRQASLKSTLETKILHKNIQFE